MSIIADHRVEFIAEAREEALKRLVKAAEFVADKAETIVPVDEGNLKKSIHVEVNEEDLIAAIIADALRKTPTSKGTPISYAFWVETGEGTGPAQPYMRPALHSSLDEIERIFN